MSVNARVLGIAERWIGTPYRHQGATRGVGCDCLGLVRGIWRELYGGEPEVVPAYAPDWAERSGEERLLQAAGRHFSTVASFEESRPGDLVLFRFRPGMAAKHAGILARMAETHFAGPDDRSEGPPDALQLPPDAFIHAYEQSAVTRSALVPGWKRKIAGIYRFPERGL
ncbi:NlpC/P60 family protein [Rhizobium sp. AG855]|uniref:NlpC/P60 family protein n=1 Tax=Rhizobium sp. AG855 TaxID=2183898 RepID=UPI000E76030A|nr:NlpC/P60 family protein [Rhizobium sp. AG855]RKE85502.1 NlpC/P60 family putative phage cell wall peptidase [Rhizobium sp. AG855]